MLLVLLVFWWPSAGLRADGFFQSDATTGLRPVLDLHGVWMDEAGNRHISPFNYFDREQISLRQRFDVPDSLDLSACYFYFEGLAWVADVYLNERLLAVTDDAFGEHLFPLAAAGLRQRGNELRIDLRTEGVVRPLYPEPFLGIFRQAFLLVRDGRAHVHGGPDLVRVTRADKAAVLAPWSAGQDYLNDTEVLRGLVSGLFRYPEDDPLVFGFRPSTEAQWLLSGMGVRVVGHPLAADSLAFYNAYPLQEQPLASRVRFWRMGDGRPGPGYGKYARLATMRLPGAADPDQLALLALLMLPVLCLLVMRLATPKFYSSQLEFLTKTQIYMELIGNNKFLKDQQSLLLNLLRILMAASCLSLLLYYLESSGTLFRMGMLSDSFLLRNYLLEKDLGPLEVLGLVSGVLLGLNLAKYLFLNIVGGVYRVSNLSGAVQNLDIFASLPATLLPLLPGVFIFFLEPSAAQVVLTVWQATFGIWILRRIGLIYLGLGRLFSFSTSLKFLYICTLEILPWIILL